MRPLPAEWPKKSELNDLCDTPNLPSSARIMSKEASLSGAEREFILKAVRENVRLDGRSADQFRPLSISFGEEYGHVKLRLGKTR